ncbi:MAG: hypothetical protein KAI43_05185 [Candidatus Aureabacteria bacterium]|nr:hypothetical protein [Candidatus Auribacterota bacterium]
MNDGQKTADEQNLQNMISRAEESTAFLRENDNLQDKEEMWVYGTKTNFDMFELEHNNMEKASEDFLIMLEKEGLVADIRKSRNMCYVFGVSQDHQYGKAILLIRKKDSNSIIAIPSSHSLNDPSLSPPIVPIRIKYIFGEIDINKSFYSHSSQRTMMTFTFNKPFEETLELIDQKMYEQGFLKQERENSINKNSALVYFLNAKRECFFEITPNDLFSVNIVTAEYPR